MHGCMVDAGHYGCNCTGRVRASGKRQVFSQRRWMDQPFREKKREIIYRQTPFGQFPRILCRRMTVNTFSRSLKQKYPHCTGETSAVTGPSRWIQDLAITEGILADYIAISEVYRVNDIFTRCMDIRIFIRRVWKFLRLLKAIWNQECDTKKSVGGIKW